MPNITPIGFHTFVFRQLVVSNIFDFHHLGFDHLGSDSLLWICCLVLDVTCVHRKIIGNTSGKCWNIFDDFWVIRLVKLWKIGLEAPGNYSIPFELISFRCAYVRDQKLSFLWFRDFWTCPWAPKPVIFIFGDARIPQIIQENPKLRSKLVLYIIFNVFGNPSFDNVQNGRRRIPPIRPINSWKSWIWDQDISKHVN